MIVAYEWFKLRTAGKLPFTMPEKSAPAPKQQLLAFFASLERELERVEFFRPPDKRATMQINLRNIFTRMAPTHQDIQTLHGVIRAIAEGRKGPARGGILDGAEAEMLRTLLAEHEGSGTLPEHGPVRGLARLLRRNPTEAERLLWQALTNDRRFAGRRFKRQTPVGPYICDFVSFPLRLVVEIAPREESAEAAETRAQRREWLLRRGYTIVQLEAADVEADVAGALVQIGLAMAPRIWRRRVLHKIKSPLRRRINSAGGNARRRSFGRQHDAIGEFDDTLRRDRAGAALAHGRVRGRGVALGPVRRRPAQGRACRRPLHSHDARAERAGVFAAAPRLASVTPPPPAEKTRYGRLVAVAANISHAALYALLVAVPAAGMTLQFARGHAVPLFGLWAIPSPWVADRAFAHKVGEAHELLADALLVLAALHMIAALWHHWVLRDRTLTRMLPRVS